MKKNYKIKNLDQVRLLTDPLKLQLIRCFAESPRTAKQVAEELGENLTKLYRHVDALHEAGLIEIVSEQRKRGTVERTFRSIAERFEADYNLFLDQENDDGDEVIRSALRASEDEIVDAILKADRSDESKPEPTMARLRRRISEPRYRELKQLLQDWLEEAQGDDEDCGEDSIEFGALIALYPIESEG